MHTLALGSARKSGIFWTQLIATLVVLLLLLAGQFTGWLGLPSASAAVSPVSGGSHAQLNAPNLAIGRTFTVNSIADDDDANTADSICQTLSGDCTLRAAISQANVNGTGDPDLIRFAIPSNGIHTFSPATALPAITHPLTIDGTTQPGTFCPSANSNGNLLIQISGVGANYAGLTLAGGNILVKGLAINGFSGNSAGTGILTSSSNNRVQCNFIGTDTLGTTAAANYRGVTIDDGAENTIGTDGDGLNDPAERNVISGNTLDGILVRPDAGSSNRISGNYIGTNVAGNAPLANGGSGVLVQSTNGGNLIGSDGDGTADADEANLIAYNTSNGITLSSGADTGNRFSQNSIFENGGLGIDLGNDGVTGNDSDDGDTGPNNYQNFPHINDVRILPSSTEIDATMPAVAITQFTVEFFSSPTCDTSGYGEGKTYLGSGQFISDGDGNLVIYATVPTTVPAGYAVTATATDPNNNTSEFSQCFIVNSLTIDDVSHNEGDVGTTDFVFTVSLAAPANDSITVDYATADNTATAGSDYTATSGTLTFLTGEISQTITVVVNTDTVAEPNETFYVNLSNTFGTTISKSQGVGTIVNDDVPPGVSINDVSHLEGNTGLTDFTFDVTLDKVYAAPVSVTYATADGTAVSTSDYVPSTGIVTFTPGQTLQQITVQVRGDTRAERDETFLVNLSDPVGVVIGRGQGIGTIRNDDAPPSEPADLVARLRLTPDREFGLASGGLISYTLTVENLGPGYAEQVVARFPLDPQLDLAYAQAQNPVVWVEKIVTYTAQPYVQIRFPNLEDKDEYSIDLVFHSASSAVAGSVVSRFAVNWDDTGGAGKSQLSNSETVVLVEGSTSLDVSGGAIEVLAVEDLGGGKLRLTGDFYAPDEIVTWWYTDQNNQSVALGNTNADSSGKASLEVSLTGFTVDQSYNFAGYGNRTEVTGGIVATIVEGQALRFRAPNATEIKSLKIQAERRSL